MSNEDGSVWLVFNGEIYNHADLRSGLEGRGHRYKTRSDSESILHAYEEFGPACLDRLRGEFAFAIWDDRQKRLFAARDRMGVKPFYFARCPGFFAFGSEIKSLLAHPAIPRRLNAPFIAHYLSFNASVAPSTPFAGSEKLPAAHAITVEGNGTFATWRYWFPSPAFSTPPHEEEAYRAIYQLFQEATRDRMMSDVPFGIFLSGGVDSGAILGEMTGLLGHPVASFTIGYDGGSEFNELEEAKASAALFGAEHRQIVIGRDQFWEALLESPRYADEPNGNPECIPLYHLSRFTKDNGVTVVQVGEGSDELFGYPGWPRLLVLHCWLRWASSLPGNPFRPVMGLLSRLSERTGLGHYSALLESHARGDASLHITSNYPRGLRESLYGPELAKLAPEEDLQAKVLGIASQAEGIGRKLDDYQQLLWFELNHRLPESILARVDRMTMSASVEARVPFLDHRLVDYTFSLPQAMRFRTGAKSLFKESIRGKILPAKILDRRKRGFRTPVQRWISRDFSADARRMILKSGLVKEGLLSGQALAPLLAEGVSMAKGRSLFQILLLCRWYQIYFEG